MDRLRWGKMQWQQLAETQKEDIDRLTGENGFLRSVNLLYRKTLDDNSIELFDLDKEITGLAEKRHEA